MPNTTYNIDLYKDDVKVRSITMTTGLQWTMEEAATHARRLLIVGCYDNEYNSFAIYDPNPDEPNSRNLYVDLD